MQESGTFTLCALKQRNELQAMVKKEILPAVSAIIFNENREVLLQRRMDTKKWCIISGHVEFGESVEDAMIREVWEEVNVRSKVIRLIGVYSSPAYTTYFYPDRIVQYVVSYFEVKLKEQIQPGLTNNESEAFAYFPLDKLPEDIDLINPNWLTDALDSHSNVFIR
jgi:8-oxo-dGTP pyrophosphatase MutT (NUDIX family)